MYVENRNFIFLYVTYIYIIRTQCFLALGVAKYMPMGLSGGLRRFLPPLTLSRYGRQLALSCG